MKMFLAIDFMSAVTGVDILSSLALVLFVIYFLWLYNWGKKQLGAKFGLLLGGLVFYLIFFLYQDLVWIPLILFLLATFGKDILERLPKPK